MEWDGENGLKVKIQQVLVSIFIDYACVRKIEAQIMDFPRLSLPSQSPAAMLFNTRPCRRAIGDLSGWDREIDGGAFSTQRSETTSVDVSQASIAANDMMCAPV